MYPKTKFAIASVHQLLFCVFCAAFLIPFSGQLTWLHIVPMITLPVLATWALLPFLKQVWKLALACTALGALLFAIPHSTGEIVLGLLGTTITFVVRFLEERDPTEDRYMSEPSLLPPGIMILLACGHVYFSDGLYLNLMLGLLITDLVLLGWSLHLKNMELFVINNRDTAGIPISQMKQVNYTMLIIFLAVGTLALILVPFTPLGDLIAMIPELILFLLSLLVRLLPQSCADRSESPRMDLQAFHRAYTPAATSSPFLDFLFMLVSWLVLAALAAFILIGIYRFLTTRMGRTEETIEDKKESLIGMERRERIAARKKGKSLSRLGFSPAARIRRTYIRRLQQRAKKGNLTGTQTPAELECSAGISADLPEAAAAALHAGYEKARYSREDVTREEAEQYIRNI